MDSPKPPAVFEDFWMQSIDTGLARLLSLLGKGDRVALAPIDCNARPEPVGKSLKLA
jgi:hypothetical protein